MSCSHEGSRTGCLRQFAKAPCYNFCVEADELRIYFSDRSLTEAAKTARIASKSARKEEEELNFNLEGQLYGAGIAD